MGLDHGDIQDPNIIMQVCMKCIDIMKIQPLHHCDFSKGIHRSCASCASAKIPCNSVPTAGREKMIALAEEAACINILSDEEKKNQLLRVRTLAMSFCDDFAEVMTPRTLRKLTGERGGKKSVRKDNGAATAAAALSETGEQNKGRQNRHPSRLRQINLTLEDEDSASQAGEGSPHSSTLRGRDLFGVDRLMRSIVESSAWLETHFKRVHQANDWQIRDRTRILEVLE
ncbi:hypothetical protein KEM56_005157, partial [Ascosphaera pollenicola]